MAPCSLNTSCHYCRSLYEVSSSKNDRKKCTFRKIHVSDLQGHCRSQVMVRIERLYMSSYLCIIVTIALSGTLLKIIILEILNFSKIHVL